MFATETDAGGGEGIGEPGVKNASRTSQVRRTAPVAPCFVTAVGAPMSASPLVRSMSRAAPKRARAPKEDGARTRFMGAVWFLAH